MEKEELAKIKPTDVLKRFKRVIATVVGLLSLVGVGSGAYLTMDERYMSAEEGVKHASSKDLSKVEYDVHRMSLERKIDKCNSELREISRQHYQATMDKRRFPNDREFFNRYIRDLDTQKRQLEQEKAVLEQQLIQQNSYQQQPFNRQQNFNYR